MAELRVAIDVGSGRHRVAIGSGDGRVLDEFDITHNKAGFALFFSRVSVLEEKLHLPVVVAMEGVGGWARPLDRLILKRGYELLNVNNVKLARFKEIFAGPAKSDKIDARKELELMHLRESLPLAKCVLHRVVETPVANDQLKRLTRRRGHLVEERKRVGNRLGSDLQAISPGLLEITGELDNLWFLNFLCSREDLSKLAGMKRGSLLRIAGVGKAYAAKIEAWQKDATFAAEVEWVGGMIVEDAQRMIELIRQIQTLEARMEAIGASSMIATKLRTIPGFGLVCSTTLAAEIGTQERFAGEASLALYMGMTRLNNDSGTYVGTKNTRQVNRHAKAAMMSGAARHVQYSPESKVYYDRKIGEGKNHNQAVRALGRHLVRVIWSMLSTSATTFRRTEIIDTTRLQIRQGCSDAHFSRTYSQLAEGELASGRRQGAVGYGYGE